MRNVCICCGVLLEAASATTGKFGGVMKRNIVLMFAVVLAACSSLLTYAPPYYRVSADNTAMLKKLGVGNINVGAFANTAEFDNDCGITAGSVRVRGKSSFEGYIRQGLVDELKAAEMFDDATPKITLTGVVEQLSVFSRRDIYTSTWTIGLRINSSNGKTVRITYKENFDAGAGSYADCKKIADSYLPSVQKTLGKIIDAPEFLYLVTP